MGSGFTLTPHIGRQAVKGTTSSYYPGGLSYSDYALTIAKDMGNGVSATLSAISTSAKKTQILRVTKLATTLPKKLLWSASSTPSNTY
jgi:hypothetical protein